jgi:hypothetical protein
MEADPNSSLIFATSLVIMGLSVALLISKWIRNRFCRSDEEYLREYFKELDLTDSSTTSLLQNKFDVGQKPAELSNDVVETLDDGKSGRYYSSVGESQTPEEGISDLAA